MFVKVAPATFPHRSLSPGAQGGPAGGAEGAKLEELSKLPDWDGDDMNPEP